MNKVDEHIVERIIEHVEKGTADKTIQTRRPIDGIQYTNIRKELRDAMAEYGENVPNFDTLAEMELDSLLKHARYEHPQLGYILALSNVDALFDPPYSFKMGEFIQKYSQDAILFFHSRNYSSSEMILFYTFFHSDSGYTIYSSAYLITTDYRYNYIGPDERK